MEPSVTAKTRQEHIDNINNYIAAREWHRQRVADGTVTDEDTAKLARCRQLAVEARDADATLPPFGE
jgi:hypothetical protein